MLTILIVEDHKEFRHAVRHFLEVSNVKAHLMEASSGEEGVLIARKIKPQMILIDYWLGGITGIEAATQIKSDNPNCSIIMLTMFENREIEQLNTQNMINTFINKGELFDKLIPSMNKILHSVN